MTPHPLRRLRRIIATIATTTALTALGTVAVGAAVLTATITASSSFSSGTLITALTGPDSLNCASSPATVTSDVATCTGTLWPTSTLSTTATSAVSTVTSLGSLSGTYGLSAPTACGVQEFSEPINGNLALPLYGVTYGTTMSQLSSTGASFNGNSGYAETLDVETAPAHFTFVGWFKTTSDQGTLLSFSNDEGNTLTADNDRELWIDSTGHLVWATATSATAITELKSTATYANGAWHFFSVELGTAGDYLYVDGSLVASTTATTAGYNYNGYWHFGWGSELNGTPAYTDTPSSAYFNGTLAGLALYGSALSSAQITTLHGETTQAAYDAQVEADGVAYYWPFDDTGTSVYTGTLSGLTNLTSRAADVSGNANNGTLDGSVALGAGGPLSGTALSSPGSSGSLVSTTTEYTNPQGFSQSLWFKTTASGGLMSFTSSQTDSPTPSNYDRMFWIDPSGYLVYGIYSPVVSGNFVRLTSTNVEDDGAWHFAVATVGPTGSYLYVDGSLVASNTTATEAQVFSGYWHLGYAYTNLWYDAPSSYYLDGDIAHAAVFPTVLTATQVATLFSATNVVAEEARTMALSPTSYWPLTDYAPSPACGIVELTVQALRAGTTSCVFPAGTGACPTPATTDEVQYLTPVAMPTPSSANNVTLTSKFVLTTTPETGVAGLHLLIPMTISANVGGFSSQLVYPYSDVIL